MQKNKNNKLNLSDKSDFKFIKNLQRPKEKFLFNESTKEVKDGKGVTVGTGRLLKDILIINFKTNKYEK